VVEYLILIYQKFTAKSVGERIVKVGQHLAKLEAKAEWHFFQAAGAIVRPGPILVTQYALPSDIYRKH